jgi:hypothetical protein
VDTLPSVSRNRLVDICQYLSLVEVERVGFVDDGECLVITKFSA